MTPLLVLRPGCQSPQDPIPPAVHADPITGELGGAPGEPGTSTTQGETGQQESADSISGCFDAGNLPFILMIGAVFYFLLIRPQQKQEKARKAMLSELKKGNRVVTSGGLHGAVTKIDDATVSIRVDKDVTLTFERGSITRIVDGDAAAKS